MNIFKTFALCASVCALTACQSNVTKHSIAGNSEDDTLFNVSLSPKGAWANTDDFPISEICNMSGGSGMSPSFLINQAPAGTNVILIQYNNDSVDGLDEGGLGTVGYVYTPRKDGKPVLLASIPSNTLVLKKPAFTEKPHRLDNIKPAAYVAPCPLTNSMASYSATVIAARRTGTFANQKTDILGTTTLELGNINPSKSTFTLFIDEWFD